MEDDTVYVETVGEGGGVVMVPAITQMSDSQLMGELLKRKKPVIPPGTIHTKSFVIGLGAGAGLLFLGSMLRKK